MEPSRHISLSVACGGSFSKSLETERGSRALLAWRSGAAVVVVVVVMCSPANVSPGLGPGKT
jgi:hypothetical protein